MSAAVLVWPGAIAIGVSLGLLGSGGSILTVPVLVYLLGQDEKLAIAGSLAIVGTIALSGSLAYLRSGLIDLRAVVLFGGPGMLGTYLGAWSAAFVPGVVQLALFAVVMLVASWFMLRPVPLVPSKVPVPRATWKIAADGLTVGVVTGLVGVGGGFLIVPALVLLGGLTMHSAVATSLVIIALKSYSGFWKYLDVLHAQQIELDWSAIGLVTMLGIVGSLAGSAVASRLPQQRLKKVFGAFLVAMGILILSQTVPEVVATR
jgi:uncharacterized membrane protein YfcA